MDWFWYPIIYVAGAATFALIMGFMAGLHEAGHVTLVFEAFNQRFDLKCKVWRLAAHNPLHAATIAQSLCGLLIEPLDLVLIIAMNDHASTGIFNQSGVFGDAVIGFHLETPPIGPNG